MPDYKEHNAQYREQYAELMDTILFAVCFSASEKIEYREALKQIWNCGAVKIRSSPRDINRAFGWSSTPQGHRYWNNIHNRLARETGGELI